MQVLTVEPLKAPYLSEIGSELEDLQKAVGSYIELVYPFDDEVCIVCNEEGKYNGSELNRSLRGDDGEIYDIVAGTFEKLTKTRTILNSKKKRNRPVYNAIATLVKEQFSSMRTDPD